MSNKSAGLISSRFRGVSGRHFDENSVEFTVLETVNFNLNEGARGDRPHPTLITVSYKAGFTRSGVPVQKKMWGP